MANRHDFKVGIIAQDLTRQGFQVQADVDNWPRPDLINNQRRPDIIARKFGPSPYSHDRGRTILIKMIIVEVETELSKNEEHAKRQEEVFTQYAQEHNNTEFRLVIA